MDLVLLYHIPPLPCSKKAQQPDQQSWEEERSDGHIAQFFQEREAEP